MRTSLQCYGYCMQKTQTGILSSASDLANFLDRRPLTSLDRIHLVTPLSKAESDEGAMLLQKKGDQHERAHLEKLQNPVSIGRT